MPRISTSNRPKPVKRIKPLPPLPPDERAFTPRQLAIIDGMIRADRAAATQELARRFAGSIAGKQRRGGCG